MPHTKDRNMFLKELEGQLVGQTIVNVKENWEADEGFELWVKDKEGIVRILVVGFSGE